MARLLPAGEAGRDALMELLLRESLLREDGANDTKADWQLDAAEQIETDVQASESQQGATERVQTEKQEADVIKPHLHRDQTAAAITETVATCSLAGVHLPPHACPRTPLEQAQP